MGPSGSRQIWRSWRSPEAPPTDWVWKLSHRTERRYCKGSDPVGQCLFPYVVSGPNTHRSRAQSNRGSTPYPWCPMLSRGGSRRAITLERHCYIKRLIQDVTLARRVGPVIMRTRTPRTDVAFNVRSDMTSRTGHHHEGEHQP